jgi:hypothetical protein
MNTVSASTLAEVLHTDGPAADRANKMALYGFLIGSWETDLVTYEPSGAKHTARGEIHAGWVLEGRAIQDVWMTPPRGERRPDAPVLPIAGNWYGTTLRVFDPKLDAWHILWTDPATQFFARQLGRAQGADIVQEGKTESGIPMRWRFTEIKPTSFHWLGEVQPDGNRWFLQVEVFARRTAGGY